MRVEVPCPHYEPDLGNPSLCMGTIYIEISTDPNYGVDADGNRGVSMDFAELTGQTCECIFTSDEEWEIQATALEIGEQ